MTRTSRTLPRARSLRQQQALEPSPDSPHAPRPADAAAAAAAATTSFSSNKWTSPALTLGSDLDVAALRERNKARYAKGNDDAAFQRRDPVLRGAPSPHRPTTAAQLSRGSGQTTSAATHRTAVDQVQPPKAGPVPLKRPRAEAVVATSPADAVGSTDAVSSTNAVGSTGVTATPAVPAPAAAPSSASPLPPPTSSKPSQARPKSKKAKISADAASQLDEMDALLDEEEVDIEI
mmetsp:Transcript_5471/g.17699  ORF Transcript_5471/g.17699 Transcript_5471/m.17699 type:complete len:234 (+) Transcript_5471:1520-2221(+)